MPSQTLDLRSKNVLLTGASSGIGAALAPILRERGARVALVGRSAETLAMLAGRDDIVIAADLEIAAERLSVVESCLSKFGHVDILINNAGVGAYGSTLSMPEEIMRRVFEVNFFAPLHLCQLAAPHMPAGSLVVNIGSVGGQMTLPWMSLYSAAKYAVTGLTDCLRVELSAKGIDVIGVYPGHVRTPFQQHSLHGVAPGILASSNNRFAISPEECARAIVRGIERRSRTAVIPAIYWIPIWFSRLMPGVFDAQLRRMMKRIGSAGS
jgi:short-subunit dehydrogenase